MILFLSFKVTKEDVDNSRPDTSLLCLKFKVTFKGHQELTDLELTFNGMRDEDSLVIFSYDLQSGMDNINRYINILI